MAQPQTVKHPLAFEHERDVDTSPFNFVPQWQGSLLVGTRDIQAGVPLLFAVDRDGKREEFLYELPGSSWIFIYDVGAGADGSIVVAGSALSSDSRSATFITWISPDRKRRVVIRIWPFIAMRATVAADGTIWAAGSLNDEANTKVVADNIIRRFDLSGKMLGTLDVKGARSVDTRSDATMSSHLLASRDRVGWLTNGCEYLEFSLDGVLRDRFDGPAGMDCGEEIQGAGLSQDNDLVISTMAPARASIPAGKVRILALDRPTRAWAPFSLPEPVTRQGWFAVFGFDGTTLVLQEALNGRFARLKRLDPVAGRPQ